MGKDVMIAVALVMTLVFLCFLILFFSVIRLWVQALLLGVPASITDIIRMRLRRIPPALIIHTAILLKEYKVAVPMREIERCYLEHGLHAQSATNLATIVVEQQSKRKVAPTGDSAAGHV
jgi:uncharacterized protein YqfA (UPF0365 family)